jgi:hypothetical protein
MTPLEVIDVNLATVIRLRERAIVQFLPDSAFFYNERIDALLDERLEASCQDVKSGAARRVPQAS